MSNPFQDVFSITLNKLPSRQRIIQEVAIRINRGSSLALIAEPRMGKSTMLEYLKSPENNEHLYGEKGDKYVFRLLNCQMIPTKYSYVQFWEFVLEPIREIIEQPQNKRLQKVYDDCKNGGYVFNLLSDFFMSLGDKGYRLILMLDEFDALIDHPAFRDNLSLLALIRGISSSRHGMITIIAMRQSLSDLNKYIFDLSVALRGSSSLNIYESLRLKPLSFRDMSELLSDFDNRLSRTDKQFIIDVSGGHPYILQITATALWDLAKRYPDNTVRHYQFVGRKIYESTQLHYQDLWHHWTPHTRKAVVAISLLQAPDTLSIQKFHQNAINDTLPYLAPEVDELLESGIIVRDENLASKFRIVQGALLWWLADELLRTVRDENTFSEWLMEKKLIGGLVSQKELDTLKTLAKSASELVSKGATSLIESYAKAIVSK